MDNFQAEKKCVRFSVALVFVLTLLFRLPFHSSYLYTWDAVQFALGIRDFNILKHQPQPPGYILFVGLARIANGLLNDENLSLTFLAALFSALSAALLFLLVWKLFGEKRTAVLASCLWMTSPLLWFYGEVGESYAGAAMASVATGLGVYLFWKHPTERKAILASGIFAASGGLRPDQMLFLAPLWLFPYWRDRACRRFFPVGAVVFVLGYLAWYLPSLHFAGGFARYEMSLHQQFLTNVRSGSVLFGSTLVEQAWTMARFSSSIIVALLPMWFVLGLAWALQRGQALGAIASRDNWLFLSVWALPCLLFYSLIHFAKLGYSLTCLAPLVLVAARSATVAWAPPTKGPRPLAALCAFVIACNTLFFFAARRFPDSASTHSPSTASRLFAKALNRSLLGAIYDEVRFSDKLKRTYFETIAQRLAKERALLVVIESPEADYLNWRMVMYYFPEVPVYGVQGLEKTILGRLRVPRPLLVWLGFWRDGEFQFQPTRTTQESEPVSIGLCAWRRALIIMPAHAPDLVMTGASPGSVRDLTPAALDPRLAEHKLFLFEPRPAEWLKIQSGTRSIVIRP